MIKLLKKIILTCDRIVLFLDSIEISGWVLTDVGIERIEAFVDGIFIGNAKIGQPRPDVAAVFPLIKSSRKSGFFLRVGIVKYSNLKIEKQNILIKAIDINGKETIAVTPADLNKRRRGINEPDSDELEKQKNWQFDFKPKISIITPTFNTPKQYLIDMLESVIDQSYSNWELCIAEGGSKENYIKEILNEYSEKDGRVRIKYLDKNKGIAGNYNEALSLANGDYIALMDHDDMLAPFALFEIVRVLNNNRRIDIVYSDEDKIFGDEKIRIEPFLKPDWSPEYFRGVMYVGHLLCVRRELAQSIGGFLSEFDGVQDYEFMLRLSEITNNIEHIPMLLYHWRKTEGSVASDPDAKENIEALQAKAVNNHLKRIGLPAIAEHGKGRHRVKIVSHYSIKSEETSKNEIVSFPRKQESTIDNEIASFPRKRESTINDGKEIPAFAGMTEEERISAGMTEEERISAGMTTGYPFGTALSEMISIIIPTKDEPEHLERCLDSIYSKSTYDNKEVILIDNNTDDKKALAVMERFPVRRILFNEKFKFSRACNIGAYAAGGKYLLFLNNDTEVISQDWLENLLYYSEQPTIGAVGALLLYPDKTVQHAGVVLGFRGTADHVMRGFPHDSDGYAGSLSCAREVSAVTGACLMLERKKFVLAGGFNEHYFTHYQDVDLCLKLREKNLRNIFTPGAVLIHHESVSRKSYYDYIDRALLLDRWYEQINRGDPYYNPNFDLQRVDYSI